MALTSQNAVKTKNGMPVEKPKYDPLKYTPKQILRMEAADREKEAQEKKSGSDQQAGKTEVSKSEETTQKTTTTQSQQAGQSK